MLDEKPTGCVPWVGKTALTERVRGLKSADTLWILLTWGKTSLVSFGGF